jgi:hypothetical protein
MKTACEEGTEEVPRFIEYGNESDSSKNIFLGQG